MNNLFVRLSALCVAAGCCINAAYSQSAGGIYSLGISVDGNVGFGWKARTDASVAGYKLYIGTASGIYSGVIDVGVVTTFDLTRLIRGMTYYFALTAYNAAGLESDFTPELTYQVPLPVSSNAPSTLDAISDIPLPDHPPYFEPIPDIVLEEGPTTHSVLLPRIHSGAANESNPLTVTAASSETNLIGISEVIYAAPEADALLVLESVPGSTGTATITVTVNDPQRESSTVSRTFAATIVNTPPTISAIPDQFIPKKRWSDPIPFTISDAGRPAADLSVTAATSNPLVVPLNALMLEGFDTNRALMIHPAAGETGVSTITLTVTDGSASTSASFQVTVDAVGRSAP